MSLNPGQWHDGFLNPFDILFDEENPRLPLHVATLNSQDAIRGYLFEWEGVLPLAESINDYKGMYPIERIVILSHGDDHIVLEGNRRVAACQILLKPNLLPFDSMSERVPKASDQTIKNLEKIPVVFVATREVADEVIGKIHLDTGRRDWSDIRQFRYAATKFKSKHDIGSIADNMRLQPSEVQKLLRCDAVFEFTLTRDWTDEEKDVFWINDLEVKPFFNLVFSGKLEKHFGGHLFDEVGRPNYDLPNFEDILVKIARHALLSQRTRQDRIYNEKVGIGNYLNEVFPRTKEDSRQLIGSLFDEPIAGSDETRENQKDSTHSGLSFPEIDPSCVPDTLPSSLPHEALDAQESSFFNPSDGSTEIKEDPAINSPNQVDNEVRQPIRTRKYFERLECFRADQNHLRQLTKELKNLSRSVDQTPIAFTLVLRATLEAVLKFHLIMTLGAVDESKFGKRPKLRELLKFVMRSDNPTGLPDEIRRRLEKAINYDWIDDLDMVAHTASGNYSEAHLSNMSAEFRPLIEYVLKDARY